MPAQADPPLSTAPAASQAAIEGRRFELRGVVQGVGCRPQVLRLARALHIEGSVHNAGTAAVVQAYGTAAALRDFEARLRGLAQGGLRIDSLQVCDLDPPDDRASGFHIRASSAEQPGLGVAPDRATCAACLAETLNRASRRHRYPFTACTDCGPRLSVFRQSPYDRANTTMAAFALCADCLREYTDPDDRRFHAQAMACPTCGPKATLRRLDGETGDLAALTSIDDIDAAATLIDRGELLLVKGIGGYQIACDAGNDAAVARLRALKRREAKPLALLVRDLDMARSVCRVDDLAAAALGSAAAPIVLLPRCPASAVHLAEGIAPGLSTLGLMLPATPLHHLLMGSRRTAIVLTSGNLSDEPQAITLPGAAASLGTAVTWVLDHDREIERRLDDSVGRVIAGTFRVLRRARGLAPAPLPLPPGFDPDTRVLALGGDLKNSFVLLRDGAGLLSHHLGGLHDAACRADQQRALADHLRFYDFDPEIVACDAHPGYASTQAAHDRFGTRVVEVDHHHAHIAACLGEWGWPLHAGPVLGIALDGLGLGHGDDGRPELWGGEFLRVDYRQCTRLGHLQQQPLLGGDRAALQPWRNTYAHLVRGLGWTRLLAEHGDLELVRFLAAKPRALLDGLFDHAKLAPPTSSCGRWFDAVAAAIGVCRDHVAYEGEAAMRLEALVDDEALADDALPPYPFSIVTPARGLPQIDPLPMWQALLGDLARQTPAAHIATRFHRGLAAAVVRTAVPLARRHGLTTVALGGGVFQNRILAELVLQGLADAGLQALLPQQVPAGDGGLAWGQALVALARRD